MPESAVVVEGLARLSKAFAVADKTLSRELRADLRHAVEPVKVTAERLAGTQIRNLGVGEPWTGMRIGVTRSFVYMVPKQRGRNRNPRRRRPRFGDLLMQRAMEPAFQQNREKIIDGVKHVLDDVASAWGSA